MRGRCWWSKIAGFSTNVRVQQEQRTDLPPLASCRVLNFLGDWFVGFLSVLLACTERRKRTRSRFPNDNGMAPDECCVSYTKYKTQNTN
ncbi:MAG: hypothetical protein V7739_17040 [Motiliproteus sp.]